MTTKEPLVSIITPTTLSRFKYFERLLKCIKAQDYRNIEHVVSYEDLPIGQKRNKCNSRANGEYIITMDDDDQYGPKWVSHCVKTLSENNIEITGLQRVNFYNEETKEGYQYFYNPKHDSRPYVAGATMAYKRTLWEKHPFPDVKSGEDVVWMQKLPVGTKGIAHDYVEGFLASIHDKNTSPRMLSNPRYRRMSEREEIEIRKRFFGAEATLSI